MLIAAVVIGLVVAYYLGLQAGIIGAATSAVLFVVAQVVPAVAIYCYLVVALGLVAVCMIGPKLERSPSNTKVVKVVRKGISTLWKKLG